MGKAIEVQIKYPRLAAVAGLFNSPSECLFKILFEKRKWVTMGQFGVERSSILLDIRVLQYNYHNKNNNISQASDDTQVDDSRHQDM